MTRAIIAALTAQVVLALAAVAVFWPHRYVYPSTQPAPCVQPADERIELHSGEDVTSAALEAFYGSSLDGGTK